MTVHGRKVARRALLGAFATLPIAGVARAADGREIASGTRHATAVFERGAGEPGPTVLVVAGIHGNERAPPVAARALFDVALVRGRLVVVPEANRPALAARSRFTPDSEHPDLNRNFPTEGRADPRGEMAPVLWRETVALDPSWVLDLHEGWGFSASSKSMGSSVVVAEDRRVDAVLGPMADRVLAAVNAGVTDASRRFRRLGPGPPGSFARAVVERLGTPALVFETTWTQAMELRVAQQRLMVCRVLEELGLVATDRSGG